MRLSSQILDFDLNRGKWLRSRGFHHDAFFSNFFLFTLPLWFFSTLTLDQWMFKGKTEMKKIAVESLVCNSQQKLLNLIYRGLLLVVEQWAKAPTQNCVSRKTVISGKKLCSCSTGRGQVTDFLLSTGSLVFKELNVGGQVSHPYIYFEGKNRWNTLIFNSLKIEV